MHVRNIIPAHNSSQFGAVHENLRFNFLQRTVDLYHFKLIAAIESSPADLCGIAGIDDLKARASGESLWSDLSYFRIIK